MSGKSGEAMIEEARQQVEAALKLLDSETADGIIGQAGEEYKTLVQGVRGVFAMLWAMFKSHGLRQNPDSLKVGGQGMAMLLTIVHYAYALGIQRGKMENRD
jgi:hypothetical protein